jgi:hypothetical protein
VKHPTFSRHYVAGRTSLEDEDLDIVRSNRPPQVHCLDGDERWIRPCRSRTVCVGLNARNFKSRASKTRDEDADFLVIFKADQFAICTVYRNLCSQSPSAICDDSNGHVILFGRSLAALCTVGRDIADRPPGPVGRTPLAWGPVRCLCNEGISLAAIVSTSIAYRPSQTILQAGRRTLVFSG